MPLKKFRPITPSRRLYSVSDFAEIAGDSTPVKSLLTKKTKTGGRNCYGRQTNRNKGGGHKRRYRIVDFTRRDKVGVLATVVAIQYDPNRTARIALLNYVDGEKRYIVAPIGLTVGQTIQAGPTADIKPGNALPLKNIPTGQPIHNVELKIGAGGQIGRSAGVSIQLVAKEGDYALLRLASGEMRRVHSDCYATIGSVSNPDHSNIDIGKAGRSRWLNRRPHNRGISKNPVDHAMGGRTNGGKHPCSEYGVPAKGLKTRNNKRSKKFIVRRRGSNAIIS
jgi:large subunit ribosomal protein L2